MWDLKACRSCLATNGKMEKMNDDTKRIYATLSGLRITNGDGYPNYICVECSTQLKKISSFRRRSRRAFFALYAIMIAKKQITVVEITKIDRKKNNLDSRFNYWKPHNVGLYSKTISDNPSTEDRNGKKPEGNNFNVEIKKNKAQLINNADNQTTYSKTEELVKYTPDMNSEYICILTDVEPTCKERERLEVERTVEEFKENGMEEYDQENSANNGEAIDKMNKYFDNVANAFKEDERDVNSREEIDNTTKEDEIVKETMELNNKASKDLENHPDGIIQSETILLKYMTSNSHAAVPTQDNNDSVKIENKRDLPTGAVKRKLSEADSAGGAKIKTNTNQDDRHFVIKPNTQKLKSRTEVKDVKEGMALEESEDLVHKPLDCQQDKNFNEQDMNSHAAIPAQDYNDSVIIENKRNLPTGAVKRKLSEADSAGGAKIKANTNHDDRHFVIKPNTQKLKSRTEVKDLKEGMALEESEDLVHEPLDCQQDMNSHAAVPAQDDNVNVIIKNRRDLPTGAVKRKLSEADSAGGAKIKTNTNQDDRHFVIKPNTQKLKSRTEVKVLKEGMALEESEDLVHEPLDCQQDKNFNEQDMNSHATVPAQDDNDYVIIENKRDLPTGAVKRKLSDADSAGGIKTNTNQDDRNFVIKPNTLKLKSRTEVKDVKEGMALEESEDLVHESLDKNLKLLTEVNATETMTLEETKTLVGELQDCQHFKKLKLSTNANTEETGNLEENEEATGDSQGSREVIELELGADVIVNENVSPLEESKEIREKQDSQQVMGLKRETDANKEQTDINLEEMINDDQDSQHVNKLKLGTYVKEGGNDITLEESEELFSKKQDSQQNNKLKLGLESNVGETVRNCEEIKERVNKKQDYRQDVVNASEEKAHSALRRMDFYKCNFCKATLQSANSYVNHVLYNHTGKPYCCALCSAKYRHKFECKDHILKHLRLALTKHSRTRPPSPQLCLRHNTTKRQRGAELASTSDGLASTRSDLGSTSADLASGSAPPTPSHAPLMLSDIKMHAPESPYRCAHCRKRFSHHDFLKVHSMMTHGIDLEDEPLFNTDHLIGKLYVYPHMKIDMRWISEDILEKIDLEVCDYLDNNFRLVDDYRNYVIFENTDLLGQKKIKDQKTEQKHKHEIMNKGTIDENDVRCTINEESHNDFNYYEITDEKEEHDVFEESLKADNKQNVKDNDETERNVNKMEIVNERAALINENRFFINGYCKNNLDRVAKTNEELKNMFEENFRGNEQIEIGNYEVSEKQRGKKIMPKENIIENYDRHSRVIIMNADRNNDMNVGVRIDDQKIKEKMLEKHVREDKHKNKKGDDKNRREENILDYDKLIDAKHRENMFEEHLDASKQNKCKNYIKTEGNRKKFKVVSEETYIKKYDRILINGGIKNNCDHFEENDSSEISIFEGHLNADYEQNKTNEEIIRNRNKRKNVYKEDIRNDRININSKIKMDHNSFFFKETKTSMLKRFRADRHKQSEKIKDDIEETERNRKETIKNDSLVLINGDSKRNFDHIEERNKKSKTISDGHLGAFSEHNEKEHGSETERIISANDGEILIKVKKTNNNLDEDRDEEIGEKNKRNTLMKGKHWKTDEQNLHKTKNAEDTERNRTKVEIVSKETISKNVERNMIDGCNKINLGKTEKSDKEDKYLFEEHLQAKKKKDKKYTDETKPKKDKIKIASDEIIVKHFDQLLINITSRNSCNNAQVTGEQAEGNLPIEPTGYSNEHGKDNDMKIVSEELIITNNLQRLTIGKDMNNLNHVKVIERNRLEDIFNECLEAEYGVNHVTFDAKTGDNVNDKDKNDIRETDNVEKTTSEEDVNEEAHDKNDVNSLEIEDSENKNKVEEVMFEHEDNENVFNEERDEQDKENILGEGNSNSEPDYGEQAGETVEVTTCEEEEINSDEDIDENVIENNVNEPYRGHMIGTTVHGSSDEMVFVKVNGVNYEVIEQDGEQCVMINNMLYRIEHTE